MYAEIPRQDLPRSTSAVPPDTATQYLRQPAQDLRTTYLGPKYL